MKHENDSVGKIQSSITQLLAALCQKPKQLSVRLDVGLNALTFIVEPTPEDYGRIIGVKAANLIALKTVLQAMAARAGIQESDFVVPRQTMIQSHRTKFVHRAWDKDAFEALAVQSAAELFEGLISIEIVSQSEEDSRVTMMVGDLPDVPNYPSFHEIAQAFGRILFAIALVQGQRIKFELGTVNHEQSTVIAAGR